MSLIKRPVAQNPSATPRLNQTSRAAKPQADGLHAVDEPANPQLISPQQLLEELQRRYFSLWGKTLEPGSLDICVVARQHGMRCLRGVVEWEDLIRLNRPVILTLKQADTEYPLLVKKARGDRVLVDDGEAEAWGSLPEIEALWPGDFVMLWRPVLDIPLLGQGSTGEAVTWLRERLALADGEPKAKITTEDRFDAALQSRLQRFQEANGLNADGIAGPWTMIMLNNLQLPPDTPTLEVAD
jgi:general secretion pathway protein A